MRRLTEYLHTEFEEKVYRLSLSSGCTCPNRDGHIGYGGCTFCSEGGSGEFASPVASIDNQIIAAKKQIADKTDAKKFIAYFQSFTNTYGDVDRLRELYLDTIRRDEIVVLSLGTRPDCLDPAVMDMLGELKRIKPVWVELGLQTIHERTAERIHRGYSLPVFEEAYAKLKKADISVIVHVIFNLPGESEEDMLETVRYLASLTPELDGVKLQMLQILKGTAMAEEYGKEPFPLMDLEQYAKLIGKCARILPQKTVLHRMTGDGPRRLLIAPLWSLDKKRVLNRLNKELFSHSQCVANQNSVYTLDSTANLNESP
ncbi:MAG: TIGR01212 family radical SAM protein [Lachnospiraceae bacterium]|nr:TIGR01212 family radical SAM protein [Lachnospiraceae bacterium]